jgi:hypothetical protein
MTAIHPLTRIQLSRPGRFAWIFVLVLGALAHLLVL